ALLGPSLTIPAINGRLQLGTWQQIVFIDFDNRPRQRRVIVQVSGRTKKKGAKSGDA
ncbi:MAG: YjbQ family protein, partial [Syntrophales bacterium]